jgi:hypothetical protein
VRTEELIVRLAADAAPVRRLPSISARLGGWFLVVLPVVAVFVAVVGPRPDLATRAAAPAFLVSALTLAALGLVSAAAALVSSVPGHERSRLAHVLPPLLIGVWAVALFIRLVAGRAVGGQLSAEPVHAACAFQISLMALFPAVALFRFVRSGASLAPGWSGMLALAASLAAGAVGSAVICPIDRAAHEALWHLLPVVSLAALGVFGGKVWLSRLET